MHPANSPALTFDEIDDLLYFVRANEQQDLQQAVSELSQKYGRTPKDVLEGAVDPESGNTVLHFCSANGLVDLLPKLLEQVKGPDNSVPSLVNLANKEGNTALHWASYNGHLDVVKLLIAAGADMWIKNSAGHLAMFQAERAEKSEVVQYLLEAGGQEVERAGTEGHPSAEDVEDVSESQQGEASKSSFVGSNGDANDTINDG